MKHKHIVVLEDEEHLALGIKYNLEAEGYQVTTFAEGPAVVQYFQEHPHQVDLLILDLMLPGMSGYAVCEKLREQGEQVPILILSARSLSEDRTRGFDVGADQYLIKPFELEELLSRVKHLVARFGSQPDERVQAAQAKIRHYRFGNSQIDFRTFEVKVGGRPVHLSRLQMTLLQYFIENEGRVIPREELLVNVWDLPGHLNTRAPDQFMRRLRTVFEPNPAEPRHFLTVRDAGYRFVAEPAPVDP